MIKNLGKFNQVGYVVKDLEASLDFWINVMGVGPWFVSDVKPRNYMYRGKPSELSMTTALANLGELQIELILDKSEGPTYYKEFLEKTGEGINHLAIWKEPEEFDKVCDELRAAGFRECHSGINGEGDGRFIYFDHEKFPGVVFEPSCMGGSKAQVFQKIADAAKNWDGTNPIVYTNKK